MRVDINKEDENYNVLRIETKDDSGDYIEILVPKDEILFKRHVKISQIYKKYQTAGKFN